MFETSNQQEIQKNVNQKSSNKENEIVYQKAKDSDILPVETGYVPDWAQTNINVEEKPREGTFNLENAESGISLVPSETTDQKNSTGKFFQGNSDDKSSGGSSTRKKWAQAPKKGHGQVLAEVQQELKVEDYDLDQQDGPEKIQLDDQSNNEIENILMKESQPKPKPQAKPKKQWGKPKPQEAKTSNDYYEMMKKLQEGKISTEDLPEDFQEKIENLAQTPKPNTEYPVPQMESGFVGGSFGSRSDRLQKIREKNEGIEHQVENIGSNEKEDPHDQTAMSDLRIPQENENSELKQQPLKSRIPGIKKSSHQSSNSKEKSKNQSYSENEELEDTPIPYSLEEEKSVGEAPKMSKFTSHQFLDPKPPLGDNLSMKNNENISQPPVVKSENISAQEEFSQKEESVQLEGKGLQDVKSESYNFPHMESVGDTHLDRLQTDTVQPKADEVTNAAVNS